MEDNVPEDVKQLRLSKLISTFKKHQLIKQKQEIGKYHLMLIDGFSKRKEDQLTGLTDTNKRVVFDKTSTLLHGSWNEYTQATSQEQHMVHAKVGDFVKVKITNATQNVLFAEPICLSSIKDFEQSMRYL